MIPHILTFVNLIQESVKTSPDRYRQLLNVGKEKSRFLPYIHNLRGLAILFIVGVHVRGYRWDWQPGDKAYDFFVALFDNGTVLFVFIAGFLFQHLNADDFRFSKYLNQKLKAVILPYLVISIPILLLRLTSGGEALPLPDNFESNPLYYKILFYMATGLHMVPFWFMPMIFLVYLSAPVLHAADNRTFYRYFFPVIILLGMFTFRPANNANPLLSYLHFIPIYITGMWASAKKRRIIELSNQILIPMISAYLIITALELTGIISLDKRMNFEKALSAGMIYFNIYVFKAVLLCFILMMLFHKLGNKRIPWIDLLGTYSFGIYFIHYYFISAFRALMTKAEIPLLYDVPIFLGVYLLVLACSMLGVYLAKRITGKYSRYLIGS
jgi:probable poly-beta-1,6-N-acetyl-D-glucosamine export protein